MCFIGGDKAEEKRRESERARANQDVVEEITPGPPADSPTFLGARIDEDRIGSGDLTGLDGDVSLPTISTGRGTPPGPTPPRGPTPGPFDPGGPQPGTRPGRFGPGTGNGTFGAEIPSGPTWPRRRF